LTAVYYRARRETVWLWLIAILPAFTLDLTLISILLFHASSRPGVRCGAGRPLQLGKTFSGKPFTGRGRGCLSQFTTACAGVARVI
jgi:hypothetical protein